MQRVLIVDDHPAIQLALTMALRHAGLEVVGCVSTPSKGIAACRSDMPDVVLVDLDFPGSETGLDLLRELGAPRRGCRFIVYSGFVDRIRVDLAYEAGASAYLMKRAPMDEVVEVVKAISRHGRVPESRNVAPRPIDRAADLTITRRQREILTLAAQGEPLKRVAVVLGISVKTVHNHLGDAYRRLGVESLAKAVIVARDRGLISSEMATIAEGHESAMP